MGLFKRRKTGRTLGTGGRYHPSLQPTAAIKRRDKKLVRLRKNAEKKLLKSRGTQRRIQKITRPIILILIGLTLYGIGHFFFISDIFTIKSVEFNPDSITVEDESKILNYLKNFEGTNILLMDEAGEEIYLKETYPEYKTINIKKTIPNKLVLDLELYEKSANLITKKDGYSRKFIINENGILIEPDTEDPSLPYIYIEAPEILLEGKQAIAPEILTFILDAIDGYESKFGMQILDVTYYKIAREVHLHTERYFDVWLDTQLTVNEQLTKLKLALPKLNIYEDDLRYIDLRISGQTGDKVIYMPG